MNIGILSMQRVNNYGSLLQAYSLKKILESEGHRVCFIDIKEDESDKKLLEGYYIPFEQEVAARNTTSRKLREFLIRRIVRKYIHKPWSRQCKLFDSFKNNELNLNETILHYDLAVIGSDEVFNCLAKCSRGYTSQLFGNIPEAQRIITYAASCGSTRYDKLPRSAYESIQNAISNIDAISVRDRNTLDFISHFVHTRIEEHFDPVLIYDFTNEINNSVLPRIPEHTCLIYSYHERINEPHEIEQILDFCSKNNMIPVTLFGPQIWCKNHIVCSPFECLKVFQNVDFVITDTFHGTIFSAKYAKRFAVMVRDSNRNKLLDLTKKLDIMNHIINDCAEIECVYSINKDQDRIDSIIKSEKQRSYQYLIDNMH